LRLKLSQGDKALPQVHPRKQKRTGTSRVNHTQLTLKPGVELRDHRHIYTNLTSSFQEVFDWATNKVFFCERSLLSALSFSSQIKERIPDVYKELVVQIQVMQLSHPSPCQPFQGFVLNINVSTKYHYDGLDSLACGILPIGNFTGGELINGETGMVIQLLSGDFSCFNSSRIGHANLDYVGTRMSLVLHSDRHGKSLSVDANGWANNKYFKFVGQTQDSHPIYELVDPENHISPIS
jgi:hypothetical protein